MARRTYPGVSAAPMWGREAARRGGTACNREASRLSDPPIVPVRETSVPPPNREGVGPAEGESSLESLLSGWLAERAQAAKKERRRKGRCKVIEEKAERVLESTLCYTFASLHLGLLCLLPSCCSFGKGGETNVRLCTVVLLCSCFAACSLARCIVPWLVCGLAHMRVHTCAGCCCVPWRARPGFSGGFARYGVGKRRNGMDKGQDTVMLWAS